MLSLQHETDKVILSVKYILKVYLLLLLPVLKIEFTIKVGCDMKFFVEKSFKF